MTAGTGDRISRREFLKRALKTTALAGLTIAGGKYFQAASGFPRRKTLARMRPYNVPGTEGLLSVARGTDSRALTRKALDAMGGMGRFIQKGERVVIKVNCAFARPSWVGATSSPEVVSETVKLCHEAGASRVSVTDNPISDPRTCFEKSGIAEAVREAGGEIILPSFSAFRTVEVNNGIIGTWEVFYGPLAQCDKLIGIPTVKTHNLSGASLAMKNWYGFFGGSRERFHQDIHGVIAELGEFITPTLVVLDGTRMLVRNGPTGGSASDVVAGNTVAASTDQVAVDAFGADMLGLAIDAVPFIRMAAARGVGRADYKSLPGYREVSL